MPISIHVSESPFELQYAQDTYGTTSILMYDSIGFFENEWNDFDKFTSATKMLHTTRRRTQPWKTGLPVDWRPAERFRLFPPIGWLMRGRRKLFGDYAFLGNYKAHPDKNQERLFFGLLLAAHAQAEDSGDGLALETCELLVPGTPLSTVGQCGWMDRPENPAEPDGRQSNPRPRVKIGHPSDRCAGG